MAITEKIKGIVDFLTQGLEQGDDVFEDMMDEAGEEYETDDNLALAPSYQSSSFTQKNDKADLKVNFITPALLTKSKARHKVRNE